MAERRKGKMLARLAVLISTVSLISVTWLPAGAKAANEPEVHVTVTVVRRSVSAPQPLPADDVIVQQNRVRRRVISWTRAEANGRQTDLAILVDDSTGNSFGNQIAYLKHFIDSLPSSTHVAVTYAEHGDASILQPFTSDHPLAAKALRLPIGRANEVSSIYMAVSSLVKHWPADHRVRDVLLISDGIDLYWGVMDSQPGVNPNLNAALRDALRANVTIYTVYASAAGLYTRNLFLINNGQSCLSLLTLDTGGQSFFQGLQTPVSFQPFLQELGRLLSNQFILTFRAAPGSKPGLSQLHVMTEVAGIQLQAPESVYVPAS
jgi:hypothetical protein